MVKFRTVTGQAALPFLPKPTDPPLPFEPLPPIPPEPIVEVKGTWTDPGDTPQVRGRLEREEPPMTGQITKPLHALKFALAGNAIVTLRSLKTGVRFTYRISRLHCDQCKSNWANMGRKNVSCADCACHQGPGKYFLSVLSGPDNTRDYRYIGMVVPGTIDSMWDVVTTRKSSGQEGSPSFVAFKFALSHLIKGEMPPQTEIWHEGRCGKCGRKLTVPESVALGIGPECLAKGGF